MVLRTRIIERRYWLADEIKSWIIKQLRRFIPPALTTLARVSGDDYYLARCVAFSPDGKYLAVGMRANDATELLTVPDLRRVSRITGDPDYWVTGVAFSPDNNYVVRAHDPGVELLSVPYLQTVATRSVNAWVYSVAFSPNGEYVAFCCWDYPGKVGLLSVPNLEIVSQVSGNEYNGGCSVAFSPNGNYVAVAYWDLNAVDLLSVPSLERVARVQGDAYNGPCGVAFSPTGNYLAVGCENGPPTSINLLLVPSLERVARVESNDQLPNSLSPYGLAFSPTGNYLAVGNWSYKGLQLFTVPALKLINQISGIDIPSVAFSPNGEYLGIAIIYQNAVELLI